jgi:hypothetical protein
VCAGAGVFEAAHITLTQGVWIGQDALAPERLAEKLSEVTQRDGESVPMSGAGQGQNEVLRKMAAVRKT